MTIEEITFPTSVYLGIRVKVSFERVQDQNFYANIYQKLGAYCAQHGIAMQGAPVSLYFSWDEEKQLADVAPSFPVDESVHGVYENPDGIERMQVDALPAVKAEHWGPYLNLKTTHEALIAYCKEHVLTQVSPCIEEYMTDPGEVEDQEKWLTNVYYLTSSSE